MAQWQRAGVPSGFSELWREDLRSVAALAGLRRRLRAEMTGRPTVERPDREHWAERLVLVADELTSNALRHGRPPVSTTLSRVGDRWMVAVHDCSPEIPPAPAQGRDPGLGGLGLYLIADLAAQHGWFTHQGTKTVWAVVAAD